MSIAPLPADLDGDGAADEGLVEMEHELTRLLIEYDELEAAWPKGDHVLVRAKIGRQAADALSRIADLQHAIATTPARTVAMCEQLVFRLLQMIPTFRRETLEIAWFKRNLLNDT